VVGVAVAGALVFVAVAVAAWVAVAVGCSTVLVGVAVAGSGMVLVGVAVATTTPISTEPLTIEPVIDAPAGSLKWTPLKVSGYDPSAAPAGTTTLQLYSTDPLEIVLTFFSDKTNARIVLAEVNEKAVPSLLMAAFAVQSGTVGSSTLGPIGEFVASKLRSF
jgi:hypothetical protein